MQRIVSNQTHERLRF